MQEETLKNAMEDMATRFGENPEIATGFLAGIMAFMAIFLLIALAVLVVTLILTYSALSKVPQEHRKMEPGLVFLLLIPIFNLIWLFFVTARVSGSLKSYFDSQNDNTVGDCGQTIGMVWAICSVCSIIPGIGAFVGIASLVCMIIYLIKITGLKGRIA